jgi:hypothetical protein
LIFSARQHITTSDGVSYIFGAKEITTANSYWYGQLIYSNVFNSAWHLSSVISADKKDTINLNYSSYTWQQAISNYQNSYAMSTDGVNPVDLGPDTATYQTGPVLQGQILNSITCRNSKISFITSTTARTDVIGTYPSLGEIDVVDSITGNTVKKNLLYYENFGQTTVNPKLYERLKLKRINAVNPQLSTDTLTYKFSYVGEYVKSVPLKTTLGIDNWGYYNGHNGNTSLLPSNSSPYYSVAPTENFAPNNNREPTFDSCAYFALDTMVYPTGGYTVYKYEQNNYYNSSKSQTLSGPGIRLSSITNYDGYTTGYAIQKIYTYLQDGGSVSSGMLPNRPFYQMFPFTTTTVVAGVDNVDTYNIYAAISNGAGVGGVSPKFYYSKVTESIISGPETHKSDYYYTLYNNLFPDIRMTKKVDYANIPNTTIFNPVAEVDNSFTTVTDTSFLTAQSYIISEHIDKTQIPRIQYTYNYLGSNQITYWIHPVSQTSIQYDNLGNSASTTSNYFFNTTTRNLAAIQQSTSDGQIITQKFKYPEDYTTALTGNMVTNRVISPMIEKEVWLKRDANDSALISGEVTQFDQTIFKPVSEFAIETTASIQSLNNETVSGGKYSSMLCTSQYALKGQFQYDGHNNPSTVNKASDINVSYIWDYKNSQIIAQVTNALPSDIAYTSFEADGVGNWTFTGVSSLAAQQMTGNYCYNLGQTSGNITKSGLTSANYYIISYWTSNSSAYTITGTQSGYPLKGKTINGWTYFEHKITGQTSITLSGSGNIDELRLYPANAQMTTYTYAPLIGKTTVCDIDDRVTYYQYDNFGRLRFTKDQDGNITKTIEYHNYGK